MAWYHVTKIYQEVGVETFLIEETSKERAVEESNYTDYHESYITDSKLIKTEVRKEQ